MLELILFVLATLPADDSARYESDWPTDLERVWIGPGYWANRLQDWRVRDGRLECVEGSDGAPLRTAHLLTRSTVVEAGATGWLRMTLRVTPLDAPGDGERDGAAGFLLGAGGPHVDPRLTALVHHRPAEDGGLLALVDTWGRVTLRDNGVGGGGGSWSIGGPLEDGELPVLAASEVSSGGPVAAIDLVLDVRVDDAGRSVRLTARDAATGSALGSASRTDVAPERLDGGLALVSHLGPPGSERGFGFQDWAIEGTLLRRHDERAFGPVLAVQYTLGRGLLKLTAQTGPLGDADTRHATLEAEDAEGRWSPVAQAEVVPDSWTFPFRVTAWDSSRDVRYRVVYDLVLGGERTRRTHYGGTIRAEPGDPARRHGADELVVASLNCHKIYTGGLKWNHDGIWFPHGELVAALRHHDPDLLFFAGDQIYEGDLDPAVSRPESTAILDYLNKWYRWCWAFGELTRDRPTVTIPDDHDVYHGNLWGAGGRRAVADPDRGISAQDAGGYKLGPRFVNAVHRTQTSHLPDPVDPTPIEQGISVYFTRLDYGGVSFAILADRQFKSSATMLVPDGDVVNGWFQNPDFDPATQADVPGAVLLGERQLAFLEEWADDWSDGVWMKAVLSQSPFTNVATIPEDSSSGSVLPSVPVPEAGERPTAFKLAADTDSNGWPPSGRDRALRIMRRAFAVHLVGDQHLGSLVQYGVDEHRDAAWAFCSPAIANTWPRRWNPPVDGAGRDPGAPPWTGDFTDGFGNKLTVWAVANPVRSGKEPANLYDRMPGYGIVRFDRAPERGAGLHGAPAWNSATAAITFECWPRWVDPAEEDAAQFDGWPRTIPQRVARGTPTGWLPELIWPGLPEGLDIEPVVQVVDEATGQVEWTARILDWAWPPVWGSGPYTIRAGEPGTGMWTEITGAVPGGHGDVDGHYHMGGRWLGSESPDHPR